MSAAQHPAGTNTLGDRAVTWTSAAGLVFVLVLLAVERLA